MTRLDLHDLPGETGVTRARRFLALCALAFAITALPPSAAAAQQAVLFEGKRIASIVHDDASSAGLAARLLGRDLTQLTGVAPRVSAILGDCGRLCVVVGDQDSALVRGIAADAGLDLSALHGQWERYARVLVRSKRDPSQRYLLIAGSDSRGAVWGVIDLTRELGISAWEWWADVKPQRVNRLAIDGTMRLSQTPAVQYRGIFLNDEDWGLQPWAAKTFEPEVGDIGPKTYARIFELMWRLKANLIWPAMHDSTTPFYQIPGNADMAKAYAIVVGTSHAEPMMRNNVREWDDRKRGEFNFFKNRQALVDYWRERAEQVKGYENLYTIGLRGKHDSGMEGAGTPEAARDALAEVMEIQRDLLAKAQGRPANQAPQALTLYKEVLDIYSTGLKVPEDVTLVWPEDNYGYINQLANPQEQARSGGSGVYYHISYWGRPHDYLWLATTHPALIREQMDRAWQMAARKIWVVNVGDIKPGEYLTQYFLDLAFDRKAIAATPREHLRAWAATQFGARHADAVAGIMTDYYDLAFERRPEFMGFGQVEPIRPNQISDYVRTGGDEAERRLDRYAGLVQRAETLAVAISADRQDAFFQLILYPVRGAASLNERILKLDLAALHAKAGRGPAIPGVASDEANGVGSAPRADSNALSNEARAAQQRIVNDTAAYNALNGGKWNGIMNPAPRDLPVFQTPAFPRWDLPTRAACGIEATDLVFVVGRAATRSFTLYSGGASVDWSISRQRGGVASAVRGRLDPANGFRQRVALAYGGGAVLDAGNVQCGGRSLAIPARLARPSEDSPAEINRIISFPATSAHSSDWEIIPGLGSRGNALRARLDLASADQPNGPALSYTFETKRVDGAELRFIALPVHPLTSLNRLRVAVRFDAGPLQTLDFETFGRSDEWKRNVLGNSAVRTIALPRLRAGHHKLEIFALDPGFVLDRIDLRLDGAPDYYGAPPTSEKDR